MTPIRILKIVATSGFLTALECTKHKQDDQAMHLNAIWTTVLLTAGDGQRTQKVHT